jgi:hypothetical protein
MQKRENKIFKKSLEILPEMKESRRGGEFKYDISDTLQELL